MPHPLEHAYLERKLERRDPLAIGQTQQLALLHEECLLPVDHLALLQLLDGVELVVQLALAQCDLAKGNPLVSDPRAPSEKNMHHAPRQRHHAPAA